MSKLPQFPSDSEIIKIEYGVDGYYMPFHSEYRFYKGNAPERLVIDERAIDYERNYALNGRGKIPYFSRYVDFNNSIRVLIK